MFDTSNVDFSKTAISQVDNLIIGPEEGNIFDKKFKIRLTSKKTGKKIEISGLG